MAELRGVEKVKHKQTGTILAVKRITASVNSVETKRLLMDLDISMRTSDCPYTVHFYGAMFREGDVMICMEVMDISLDKFYARAFNRNKPIPEDVLGKVAYSVICALDHLHTKLQVIHRDVKPSNILLNRTNEVKMCDFGISGYLEKSIAKTIDAGCKPYMAPEMIEISTGEFPYHSWKTPFEQLHQVVMEAPPKLPPNQFTPDFEDFINRTLQKEVDERANYPELLQHPFLVHHAQVNTNISSFVSDVLDNSTEEDEKEWSSRRRRAV